MENNLLVIPDKTKVSKEVWDKYINRLLTKPLTEQMIINYNLYYGK